MLGSLLPTPILPLAKSNADNALSVKHYTVSLKRRMRVKVKVRKEEGCGGRG
jgi:hypothetical protein